MYNFCKVLKIVANGCLPDRNHANTTPGQNSKDRVSSMNSIREQEKRSKTRNVFPETKVPVIEKDEKRTEREKIMPSMDGQHTDAGETFERREFRCRE